MEVVVERDTAPTEPQQQSLVPVEPKKRRGRKPVFHVGDVVTCAGQDGEFTITAIEGDAIEISVPGEIVKGEPTWEPMATVNSSALTKVKPARKTPEFAVDDVVQFDGDFGKLWKITTLYGTTVAVCSLGSTEEAVVDIVKLRKARKRREARPQNPDNPAEVYITPVELAGEIVLCAKNVYGIRASLVLEPSAGSGSFVASARRVYPDAMILANEIDPERQHELEAAGANDIRIARWEDTAADEEYKTVVMEAGGFDIILTNPPYSLFEEHVVLDMAFLNANGLIFALLRLNALCGADRGREFWEEARAFLVATHPIPERPSFTSKGTDATEYGVYVFAGTPESAKAWRTKIYGGDVAPVIGEPIWWKE